MDEPMLAEATLVLTGDAERTGPDERRALASERGAALADRLVERFAVDGDRIRITAFGAGRSVPGAPVVEGDERRVEIILRVPTASLLPPPPPDVPAAVATVDLSGAGLGQTLPLQRPFLGNGGHTVDFWVRADWDNRTTFDADPLVYALSGPDGIVESVHITPTRDGISYFDGNTDAMAYTRVPFDFSDGHLHHVAIVNYDGSAEVWIDGTLQGYALPDRVPGVATHLDVGGFDLSAPFLGAVGDVRLWSAALTPEYVAQLMTTPGDPGATFAPWPALSAIAAADDFQFSLNRLDPVLRIADGPWTTYGSDHVEIRNRDAFEAGSASADIGSLHVEPHGRSVIGRFRDAAAVQAEIERPLRQFSIYPLFLLQNEPPREGPAHTDIVGGQFGEETEARPPDGHRLAEITVFTDPQTGALTGLVTQHEVDKPGGFLEPPFATGYGTRSDPTTHRLYFGERIIGLSGVAGDRVHLSKIHTNWRVLALPGTPSGPAFAGAEPFSIYLPAADPYGGLLVREDLDEVVALGLLSGADHTVPAIIIHEENGEFTRYEQTSRNRYTRARDRDGHDDPRELHVEGREIIRIDGVERAPGIAHDIVPITAHDRANPEDPFDNVFIAQAKAVNLDASYVGYDVTRMDPLHLVDNGTSKRVFQMPGAGSTAYHDFNRIFVPNGLLYVPEFSGRSSLTSRTNTSSQDYQRQFSSTVGVNFNIAGAKFGRSETMRRVRSKMSEQKRVITTSISRSLFYNLALDKARMPLDRAFRDRVERLADTGDFEGFIEVFGTHYPVAVVYGGMGVLEMEFDFNALKRMRAEGIDVTTSAGLEAQRKVAGLPPTSPQTQASAAFTLGQSRSKQEGFASAVENQVSNFYWVGGTHAGASKESWSVGVDGAVPIYVELRPLHELLAPPFFTDPEITHRVRFQLREATETYLKAAAAEEAARAAAVRPRLFELSLGNFTVERRRAEDTTETRLIYNVRLQDSVDETVDVYANNRLLLSDLEEGGPRSLDLFWNRVVLQRRSLADLGEMGDGGTDKHPKYYLISPDDVEPGLGVQVDVRHLYESERGSPDPDPDDRFAQNFTTLEWSEAVGGQTTQRLVLNSNGCARSLAACSIVALELTLREVPLDEAAVADLMGLK